MNALKAFGRAVIIAIWLFDLTAIHLIVLSEIFVLGLLVPFNSFIGTTMGDNVVYQPWHRGLFLSLPPLICAVGAVWHGQQRLASRPSLRTRLALSSVLLLGGVNTIVLSLMAFFWSESVIASPLAAILVSFFMSAAATGLSIVLTQSPLAQPPYKGK